MADRVVRIIFPQPSKDKDGKEKPAESKTLPYLTAWGWMPCDATKLKGRLVRNTGKVVFSPMQITHTGRHWVMHFDELPEVDTYTLYVKCRGCDEVSAPVIISKPVGRIKAEPPKIIRDYGPLINSPGNDDTIGSSTVYAYGSSDDTTHTITGSLSHASGYFQSGTVDAQPTTSLGLWSMRFLNVPNAQGYVLEVEQNGLTDQRTGIVVAAIGMPGPWMPGP